MARFNEILVGRYNRYLQKLLAMKGGPPSAQLASEIGVQIQLFHGVETRYLEGWDRFSFITSNRVGVAAQATSIRVRNPGGSNTLIVFERISAFSGITDELSLERGAPPQTDLTVISPGTVQRMDSRGRPLSTAVFSTNDAVNVTVALNPAYDLRVPVGSLAGEYCLDNNEIPLLPGDALQVRQNTVGANSLIVSWMWRERFFEDSERT
jgi:hypothetical protein